jgi:hypothetical protein
MTYIDEKRAKELLLRWPLIRRNLSDVISSRRLEEIDELIEDLWDVITPAEEENR